MNSDMWNQVRELLAEGLEMEQADRPAWLKAACGSDLALAAEVESLLSSASRTDICLDRPLIEHNQDRSMAGFLFSGDQGEYRIIRLIGEGGTAAVYEAVRAVDNERVAIKVLHQEAACGEFRSRFLQEAGIARQLTHPNVVRILATFEAGQQPAIAMELVEGRTLDEAIPKGGMTIAETVSIAIQISAALAFAHNLEIVHRDLKPANIKLLNDGSVKILDFGAAKQAHQAFKNSPFSATGTATGFAIGSPAYMSPEQAMAQPAGPLSDVFSFGVVVHEMLTGEKAFLRSSVLATLSAIIRESPPPIESCRPGVPRPLRDLVNRCLQKNPKDRPKGMQAVQSAVLALRTDFSGPIRRWFRMHRW